MFNGFMFTVMSIVFVCIFVTVFGLIVVTIVMSIFSKSNKNKDRFRQIATWSYQKGFLFNPQQERNFREAYADFPQITAGDGDCYAHNIMHGRDADRGVICFDYHYITRSTDKDGKSQTSHHEFSAVIIEAGFALRKLSVRPENIFDRVGAFIGCDDIDFESAQFSRMFHVKCDDRRWAYDVIHPKTMEFMMARPKYMTHMFGERVLVYDGRQWDADEFDRALRFGQGLLDLIPAGVVDEMRGIDL